MAICRLAIGRRCLASVRSKVCPQCWQSVSIMFPHGGVTDTPGARECHGQYDFSDRGPWRVGCSTGVDESSRFIERDTVYVCLRALIGTLTATSRTLSRGYSGCQKLNSNETAWMSVSTSESMRPRPFATRKKWHSFGPRLRNRTRHDINPGSGDFAATSSCLRRVINPLDLQVPLTVAGCVLVVGCAGVRLRPVFVSQLLQVIVPISPPEAVWQLSNLPDPKVRGLSYIGAVRRKQWYLTRRTSTRSRPSV